MFNKSIIRFLSRLDKKLLGGIIKKHYSKSLNYPNAIAVDITGICNLTCTMCSLKDWYPKNINKTIPDDILEKIYATIPYIRSISLMNNCEPLINKNIVSIIKKIKFLNPKIHVTFVTNGMLLNSNLSSNLIDTGIDLISFSIDGAKEETNDNIRRGAKLSKVLKNIRELIELKLEKKSTLPRIGTITVASSDNINELCDIVNLADNLNVDMMSFNGLEPYDLIMDKKKLWDNNPNPEFKNIYAELKLLAKRKGIPAVFSSLKPQIFSTCILVDVVIDANGEVYPCSSLSYVREYYFMGEKSFFPRISFGNLSEQSLYDIWNSADYKNFRINALNGDFQDYCKKCLFQRKVTCAI